jgi:hypothetical protein
VPVVPVLGRLRQEDSGFEASLGHIEFQANLGYPCAPNYGDLRTVGTFSKFSINDSDNFQDLAYGLAPFFFFFRTGPTAPHPGFYLAPAFP